MARRKPRVTPQAKYDAAGTGRRIKSWQPPASGPNRAIEGLQKIRNRSRDTARNDWAGESGIQKWTTNLIGVGITPRWEDADLTRRWGAFVPNADADGVLDAYGLQTLGTRSLLDSGEVFVRRRPRSLALPLSAPVQLQLLEADFCPLFDADQWPGLPSGNTIRQGIERNRFGRRVAYWMYREHPGDKPMMAAPASDDLLRISADDIAHVFEPKRPGQLRGVSMLAPVLVRLRASMDFEDAVLDRQKLANLFTMFITQQMPPDTADIEYDPLTGLPVFYDAQGKALVGLEPGISQHLLPGEDVKFANPPEAGTTYSEYMRTTHLGTAAGAGIPYELFSGDIKDVSDRTLRVAINEFRRFARQRQWQTLIPQMCQKMVNWWAEAEVLAGLPLSKLDAARTPKWSPHGWEYIHPTQDAEGKAKLIEIGVISRSDVIGERGDDPRTVDEERAADLKRSKALGLEPPPPPKPAAPPKPTTQALELEALTIRERRATVSALERPPEPAGPSPIEHLIAGLMANQTTLIGHVATIAAREPAPPVINNNLPELVVENHTHVEPTPIEIDVQAAPAAVTNVVNVEPTPVNVNLPDRQITSVIERDDEGQITNVVQTETTLQ